MWIRISWQHLAAIAAIGAAFMACSSSDSSDGAANGTSDASSDDTTTGHEDSGTAHSSNDAGKADSSTDSGSTDSGSTDADAGDDSDAIPTNCTEITFEQFWLSNYRAGETSTISGLATPNFGDGALQDRANVEIYGSAFDAKLNGEDVGTFDLSSERNYATCSRCIRVEQDNGSKNGSAKVFFQRAGTLTFASDAQPVNGVVKGSLSDVTLIEVTIDETSYVSTPVDGGACLHIKSSTFDVSKPAAPAAWTCNADYYGDAICDCGCGVLDADCADSTVGSCELCEDDGSCATQGTCPSNINPAQNWLCTAPPP